MALSYGIPYGFDFLEVPSNPSVSPSLKVDGQNIRFTFDHSQNECIVGKNSYLSIQLQIVQTREDGSLHCLEPIINSGTRTAPTNVSVPYLCNNPGGSIFNTVKCIVKVNEVSSINSYAASVNTIYRTLYESRQEQDTVYSTNGIHPLNQADCGTTGGVLYDDVVALTSNITSVGGTPLTGNALTTQVANVQSLLTKHMVWALKYNEFGFDKINTTRINTNLQC